MPSFDIVSEVDLQEARNAVDNASREVESRFDFRGVEATFELNEANKTIKVLSESDFQVNQLLDILRAKLEKLVGSVVYHQDTLGLVRSVGRDYHAHEPQFHLVCEHRAPEGYTSTDYIHVTSETLPQLEVVPSIEIPPFIPSLGLKVCAARCSPSGTEITTLIPP